MVYKEDRYIYPPRIEKTFPRSGIDVFDNGIFMAQPKFNGDCCEIYVGGNNWKIMSRHKSPLKRAKIDKEEILSIIDNNGVNLIVGEYMDSSKRDENNQFFNNKFVIFDIIVYNNDYLIGKTFQERIDIINNMLNPVDENIYSYKITDNVYLTKTFYGDFGILWDDLVKIDMIEGLVFKRKNAGLEIGTTKNNNTHSQLKCRKSNKNYLY